MTAALRAALRDPLWALAALAAAVAFAAARAWNPEASGLEVCVFRILLDLPCPGCGLTRAMSHLARGSLARAFVLHPLAPLLALEIGLGWAAWGILGRERLGAWLAQHAEVLVALHAVPLFGLWLGRSATGTLPF